MVLFKTVFNYLMNLVVEFISVVLCCGLIVDIVLLSLIMITIRQMFSLILEGLINNFDY